MRSTYAYKLLLRCLASEIVLLDQDHESAEGEAMDLNHSTLFARPLCVWAGDFTDGGGVNIIVLAAGVAQQSGGTRLELLKRNPQVCQEIIPQIVSYTIDALLIVVTHQIDILTEAAWGLSGLPAKQVIVSGTNLDTARFLYLLNKHFHVEPRSVHAFIIGKDVDSQVPVWGLTNIVGIRLEDFGRLNGNELSDDEKETIALDRRRTAYGITQRKGGHLL